MDQDLQNLMKKLDEIQAIWNTTAQALTKAMDQMQAGFDTRLGVLRTQAADSRQDLRNELTTRMVDVATKAEKGRAANRKLLDDRMGEHAAQVLVEFAALAERIDKIEAKG